MLQLNSCDCLCNWKHPCILNIVFLSPFICILIAVVRLLQHSLIVRQTLYVLQWLLRSCRHFSFHSLTSVLFVYGSSMCGHSAMRRPLYLTTLLSLVYSRHNVGHKASLLHQHCNVHEHKVSRTLQPCSQ